MARTDSVKRATPPFVRAGFRADIHGLRALAVLVVLVYHAGLPLSGGFVGVDVFFVISGFLITNHLLSELARSSRVRFADFYVRRARRILPASLTVAAATVVLAFIVLPSELVKSAAKDAVATVFYVPNFLFAVRGTDYLAETAASPFQHYWSLGVEEQFYLLWPLVLLGLWKLAKSASARVALVASIVVASLLTSAFLVETSGPWAYFSPASRAWELGVGALVALAFSRITLLPRAISAVIAWLGIVAIVLAAILYGDTTPFPGFAALLPVLGAAGVIAFGGKAGDAGPLRLLRLKPFQFLGTISYSLYLVHWPLIVFVDYLGWVPSEANAMAKVLVALVSVPIAWLIYRFVERPFIRSDSRRARTPRRTVTWGIAASTTVAVMALSAFVLVDSRPTDAGREAAAIVEPSLYPSFTSYVPSNLEPSLANASESIPVLYVDGCHLRSAEQTENPECKFGDLSATRTIALFGDSHAAQWFPALEQEASEQSFALYSFTKSSCPSVAVKVTRYNVRDDACEQWRTNMTDRLNEIKPELVVISNLSNYTALDGDPVTTAAWKKGYSELRAALDPSIELAVIADTPHFDETPTLCLEVHLESAEECASPRTQAIYGPFAAADAEASAALGATFVDLTDYFCDADSCGVIIGSTLVYRDSHHVTVEYSTTLSAALWESLPLS
ncbi:acyltransferase [Salinibacterium sp. NSLL150]|uniref:acyltransferase family protein n=1 Tax=unclassified Salinibacterium TaxID=2632331 RepID=UPI0018CEF447|nr:MULTISPECIES: acyltransferase family protein [unclassified Salinibacterium]MBH0098525.1 acyltransferase [Salinibacterium sp. NSLL35]MBH0101280.1 acyltransferase [Salinibacterium sp. NSLL150]MBH0104039.1 acyltransferase [Salinibacterium sp. NSLL16]MBH0106800.1 acyltransferase [Salinibacterium sp. NSLL17]